MPDSMEKTRAIGKILSPNDVGKTGSHQVGIYIPKVDEVLNFFPALDPDEINPQILLDFEYDRDGTHYEFKFVYYNKALHGLGTRDEYRLTRTTEFFRHSGLQAGMPIVLSREGGQYYVSDRPPPGAPLDENWALVH